MQDHRKLLVWQKAQALSLDIRRLTNRFPRRGYSELKSQLNSAAESIVLTIVEGCGAATQREFARFLDMAIKSTKELEGGLELAKDNGIAPKPECHRLLDRRSRHASNVVRPSKACHRGRRS